MDTQRVVTRRRADIIVELKHFKRALSEQLQLRRMILFGSAARDRFGKDSDIDLILVSEEFNKLTPLKRVYAVTKFWDLDYPKDILCYTPSEFNRLRRYSVVVKEALKEGIRI